MSSTRYRVRPPSSSDEVVSNDRQGADTPLPPPRPFFLGSDSQARSSWSSVDTTPGPASIQPGTLNDSESVPLSQLATTTSSPNLSIPLDSPSKFPIGRLPRISTAPPSSFVFPAHYNSATPAFLAKAQNVDAESRRSSLESLRAAYITFPPPTPAPNASASAPASVTGHAIAGPIPLLQGRGDGTYGANGATGHRATFTLAAPIAPFAGGHSRRSPQDYSNPLSATLSPASRSSSFWTPPTLPWYTHPNASSAGGSAILLATKKDPMRSTILQRKLSMSDKPWLKEPDGWERLGWWTTFLVVFLGAGASAAFCLFNFRNIQTLPKTCLVLEDNFDTLDLTTWTRDVELGGFGNGEFQMTTSSPNNSFTRNGQLYILPTLTSDVLGRNAIFDGNNFTLSDCTSTNKSACAVTSNAKLGTVIQPAQSARLSTTRSASIRFGKVEVRAKLPRGDWLWPSIWMLPVNETYGTWPRSGEIDIMQSRGNGPTADPNALIPFGFNTVTSALRFGPLPSLLASITGVQSRRRSSSAFAGGFHTYTLEWDEKYIRISVDGRVNAMLELDFSTGSGKGMKGDFFARGGFPDVAVNGTGEVVVQDPWAMGSRSAPFDQDFYLMINLAVGGTSGWFPDGVGDKPWFDSSATAMRDFALMQDNWAATWPGDADDRAFRIDSVKMWNLC